MTYVDSSNFERKHSISILIVDVVVLVIVLVSIFFLFRHVQPLVIGPVSEENVLFSFDNASYLSLSTDLSFNYSQAYFGDEEILRLGKGTYYFIAGDDVRELNVSEPVELILKRKGFGYEVLARDRFVFVEGSQ